MRRTDLAELLLLGALWGLAFVFTRFAVPEFGPLALVALRVGGAAMLLLPLLAWRGESAALRTHWRPLLMVGLANSALPFAFFSLAALALNAGLMGIFNATAPLWGALIAWAWLGQRPGGWQAVGLAIGFAGVLGLGWNKASLAPGEHGISPALGVLACLAATLCYGYAANYTRQRLHGVPPLAVAAGSQLAATLLMLPLALWAWPATLPSGRAWAAVAVLALVCTGFAYLLFFRLIAHVGPARAITVTYLIPVFAIVWAGLLLAEQPTPAMVAGCAVVLLGTALATGVITPRRRLRPG